MLILTRKIGQKIIIDGTIQIELLRVMGSSAAIGIKAPQHVSIHREEIQALLQHEQNSTH